MGMNIALLRPKNRENIGSIIRTAQNFNVNSLFIIGGIIQEKYKGDIHKFDHQMNTQNGLAKLNLMYFEDIKAFLKHLPAQTTLVLVETYDDAEDIIDFLHPENSIYVFGRETNGILKEELDEMQSYVKSIFDRIPKEFHEKEKKVVKLKKVRIKTANSLNIGNCAAIIMYDRYCKNRLFAISCG